MRIPQNVRAVANLIGMESAVRLIHATHSNGAIYIPHGDKPSLLRSSRQIKDLIPAADVAVLQREYGGELLAYPTRKGAQRMAASMRKVQRIKSMAAHHSAAFIAQSIPCSERYVRRVLKTGSTSSGWKRRAINGENVITNENHK